MLTAGGLSSVGFKSSVNCVDDERLVVGFVTKQIISKLLRERDISANQHATFQDSLVRAAEYLLQWCSLED